MKAYCCRYGWESEIQSTEFSLNNKSTKISRRDTKTLHRGLLYYEMDFKSLEHYYGSISFLLHQQLQVNSRIRQVMLQGFLHGMCTCTYDWSTKWVGWMKKLSLIQLFCPKDPAFFSQPEICGTQNDRLPTSLSKYSWKQMLVPFEVEIKTSTKVERLIFSFHVSTMWKIPVLGGYGNTDMEGVSSYSTS